jgi:hypothetical protein
LQVSLYIWLHIILITFIYFSNLIWDEDLAAFLESTYDPSTEFSETCAICDSQAIKRKSETPILNNGNIFYLGTVYHKLDFIYILNEQDEDAPYEIGQILDFAQNNKNNTIQLQIRKLKHYNDFAAEHKLNSFNQMVCDNNFSYSFTYIAILASSLLHITNKNHFC